MTAAPFATAARALAPGSPAGVVAWYVGILFAVVAAVVNWPTSGPLLVLLLSWLVPFFLIAIAVIALTFSFLAVSVYRGVVGSPLFPRPGGLWDRDLDGAGVAKIR